MDRSGPSPRLPWAVGTADLSPRRRNRWGPEESLSGGLVMRTSITHSTAGTRMALLATALIACTAAESVQDTIQSSLPPATSSALVGVVGHWSDTTIGSPALVA